MKKTTTASTSAATRPGVTKLPVFTPARPRPSAGVAAPGPDLLPPEVGFIVDARRIAAIHERQKELAEQIPRAQAELASFIQEAETLYKENHELRDAIAIAAGPDGWHQNAAATASVTELRRRP